jgi:hypothetical protein
MNTDEISMQEFRSDWQYLVAVLKERSDNERQLYDEDDELCLIDS